MLKPVLIILTIIITIIAVVKLFNLKTNDDKLHELDTTGKTDFLEKIYRNKIT